MEIRKSERKKAKIKLALQGSAGSGKTYSSLLLAKGLLDSTGCTYKMTSIGEMNKLGTDMPDANQFGEKLQEKIDVDVIIATPDMMAVVSKIAKVLGPKGLMPNPKLGSVTDNLKKAITDAKSGQAEIRNDKDGNIGVSIGKKSFSEDQLIKNYNAILDALEKEKSNNTLKGELIRSVFATSTMGVSYKVKLGKSI